MEMIKADERSALIIIDVQKAWDLPTMGKRNNPNAESNISILLKEFRRRGLMIIHVRHLSYLKNSPFKSGLETFEFKDEVKPLENEYVITKRVNSAFIGTDLDVYLRMKDIKRLFITGITTDHCVSITSRMAGNLGYETYVVEDCCATFERRGLNGEIIAPEFVHLVNLSSINGEFAQVISLKDIEFQ